MICSLFCCNDELHVILQAQEHRHKDTLKNTHIYGYIYGYARTHLGKHPASALSITLHHPPLCLILLSHFYSS